MFHKSVVISVNVSRCDHAVQISNEKIHDGARRLTYTFTTELTIRSGIDTKM